MCDTCGCNEVNGVKYLIFGDDKNSMVDNSDHKHHSHLHEHNEMDHHNSNNHLHQQTYTTIKIEQDILIKNNLIAERNRGYFEAKNIKTINFVSSPGSGKTSLLERTINDLKNDYKFFVIEGDQQSTKDAERIKATGANVIQINTGNGCHLDAQMVNNAIKMLNISDNSFLMIENVGNLVCPSLFDLGEKYRVLIFSVTEGEDKPLKYPSMFHSAHLCIINKIDLLPYVDFSIEKAKEYILQINHHLEILEVSVKTGQGLDMWYDWIKKIA